MLHRPRVGRYALHLHSSPALNMPPITVRVVEGDPHRLHIRQQPSATASPHKPLDVQPILELRDAADNQVLKLPGPPPRLTALVWPPPVGAGSPWQTHFETALFQFRHVSLVATYGYDYHLNFSVNVPGVPNITSTAIRARPCHSTEFYIRGDTACRACPLGANCTGTAVLRTLDNYWRQEGSLTFLPCRPVRGAAGSPCKAGAVRGACSEGFTGDLCAVCEAGRVFEECTACPAQGFTLTILLATLLGFVALVAFSLYKAFHPDNDLLAMLFKMLVRPPRPRGTAGTVLKDTPGRFLAVLFGNAYAPGARGLLPARTRPQRGGATPPPPLYRPQNGCTEQWVLRAPEAPEILFFACFRGYFFCLTRCVYTQKTQNFVENLRMDEKHKKGL